MAKGYGRGMPGMGGGMNMNMIKQAQKMQQDMLRMQQELQEKEYQAASGGGVISRPGASSFFHVEKETKKTPALQAGRLIMVPFFRPRHGLDGLSCCGPLPGRSVSFGVRPYQ